MPGGRCRRQADKYALTQFTSEASVAQLAETDRSVLRADAETVIVAVLRFAQRIRAGRQAVDAYPRLAAVPHVPDVAETRERILGSHADALAIAVGDIAERADG